MSSSVPYDSADPKQFITDFFNRFRDAVVAAGDDELAAIYDQFHTPDIDQTVDGRRMERDALIEQVRAARGHAAHVRIDVRDALADGDLLAARYLVYVGPEPVDGGTRAAPVGEGYFFGRFTPDGRMRRADLVNRKEATSDEPAEPAASQGAA